MVRRESFWLIAPYATWMLLMLTLPATVVGYAIRTVAVAVLLAVGWARGKATDFTDCHGLGGLANRRGDKSDARVARDSGAGVLIGLLVFAVWILPEQFDWAWYRQWCIVGEGGTRAVAEASAAMIAVRLVGSAFVISVAEELFFRKWLIGFAGFAWMVALFAVEHDRWLVGAIAGAVYGALYLRRGILAAIVAHATTNLVLGLWVLRTGQWQFW